MIEILKPQTTLAQLGILYHFYYQVDPRFDVVAITGGANHLGQINKRRVPTYYLATQLIRGYLANDSPVRDRKAL